MQKTWGKPLIFILCVYDLVQEKISYIQLPSEAGQAYEYFMKKQILPKGLKKKKQKKTHRDSVYCQPWSRLVWLLLQPSCHNDLLHHIFYPLDWDLKP